MDNTTFAPVNFDTALRKGLFVIRVNMKVW